MAFFFYLRESRATIIRDLNSLERYLGIHPLQYAAPCLPQHNASATSECTLYIHPPWCRVQGMLPRKRDTTLPTHASQPRRCHTRVMSEPSMESVRLVSSDQFRPIQL